MTQNTATGAAYQAPEIQLIALQQIEPCLDSSIDGAGEDIYEGF